MKDIPFIYLCSFSEIYPLVRWDVTHAQLRVSVAHNPYTLLSTHYQKIEIV